jgi:hypothetical protein
VRVRCARVRALCVCVCVGGGGSTGGSCRCFASRVTIYLFLLTLQQFRHAMSCQRLRQTTSSQSVQHVQPPPRAKPWSYAVNLLQSVTSEGTWVEFCQFTELCCVWCLAQHSTSGICTCGGCDPSFFLDCGREAMGSL